VSNEEIAKSVVKKLSKLNRNLSVAESITGGGLARALTDEVKINQLSVSKSNLKKYGPVSEEVVLEMANSCLKKFKTDYALATTGVAGPGMAYGKKAGTVWVAVASKKESFAVALSLPGTREVIRHATIASALSALERILKP
jgi:nicotinamide-nucleotide amidase